MTENNTRYNAIRNAVQAPWDEDRASKVREGVERRHRQRTLKMYGGAVALALVCLVGLAVYMGTSAPEPSSNPLVVHFADGSRAFPAASDKLVVTHSSKDAIILDLEQGKSRFEVTHNPKRRFVVRAGAVQVTVLGTSFSVDRGLDDQVHVHVVHGRVQVEAPGGTWVLGAGEGGEFPGQMTASAPTSPEPEEIVAVERSAPKATPINTPPIPTPTATDSPPRNAPKTEPTKRAPRKKRISPSWKQLAEQGRFNEAAVHLESVEPAALQGANTLIHAAEVMRFAGRGVRALRYLEALERRYPNDPQTSLALFWRGRILLAKQPCRAAPIFERIQKLGRPKAFLEDALAREVMALARCGKLEQARSRAKVYVRRYPKGHHRSTVRRYAGEAPTP